jgi:hypothetical protein
MIVPDHSCLPKFPEAYDVTSLGNFSVRLSAVESRTVRSRTEGMWASGVAVVAADRHRDKFLYIVNSQ